ncbi:hypothetical protein Glove_164g33 [Diversispora epigaea]|uniref:Protein kinase domain-containing protein n=1 Tax=Diversispora epigaea TaxID=1348612 RepID=A0A397IR74_9GLOM|nr:hypothetical protein Glove_164g33 [Diversispora epigaea]
MENVIEFDVEIFRSVEYLTKVGFGKVHRAMRSNGYIKSWNHESKVWHKAICSYVCLKSGWETVIYGITFNPKENEYMMVLRYKRYTTHGSLRNILNNEFTELTWKSKIKNLLNVIVGLAKIHEFGLMHKDLHSVSENNQEKIYGVIPFMAPETFRDEYTQKSGIYSFGMIMLEVFTKCAIQLHHHTLPARSRIHESRISISSNGSIKWIYPLD